MSLTILACGEQCWSLLSTWGRCREFLNVKYPCDKVGDVPHLWTLDTCMVEVLLDLNILVFLTPYTEIFDIGIVFSYLIIEMWFSV